MDPATQSTVAPVDSAAVTPKAGLAPPADSGFAQMRLKVGDPIYLELQSRLVKGRSVVTVLGWLDDQSLMVTAPKEVNVRLRLKEGEVVLLRLFSGQNAFAFSATVQKAVNSPFQYLHVSFPHNVERASVRNSPRCRVNLPATLTPADKPPVEATLLNIGTTGALIETVELAETDGSALQIALSFDLHGVPVSLNLHASISGMKNKPDGDSPRHQYGVRFSDLTDNDRLILGSLLYYQMLEHPRSVI
jgi:Flagellar protein YcgR/PilZ domain